MFSDRNPKILLESIRQASQLTILTRAILNWDNSEQISNNRGNPSGGESFRLSRVGLSIFTLFTVWVHGLWTTAEDGISNQRTADSLCLQNISDFEYFFYITVNPMWCHSNFWCPRGSFLPIISGNLPEIVWFFAGLSNFYMVKYCEIFKMASSKILVFQHRLKTRSQAPES